ncbi:EVE domain-containing protein [Vibrio vulnificus]|uniref:EVE domain-containing protein n=1 Tax=Vibrio parahaemolyticus TaxID=670 RepID=UPI000A39690C|nr:EVE domain-containing protein [Vibrio parahaemolyticus]EGQ9702514.1 EVE domain-containing protein [Vibrio parahaemolyticus]EGR2734304.1 EVE domain-containing protein [Vibrio parahaemolyticus]EGR2885181.1 EVE domain-containing protein [Vibrio parahaemolyticus]EGR2977569.1 EVE domain-containing protein [Vibrio parahaemolyticus]EGR3012984.1 EVE domain-containing protein [Vibrio parahaemolyticus]
MADWIFRGNRSDFDIDTYLRDFEYIYWAVKHPKHQHEMQLGDRVFIWRSKGNSKEPYGLVGYGTIVEEPTHKSSVNHPEFLLEEFWEKREVSEIKVGVKLESVRLNITSGLVESTLLIENPSLANMQLLTARQGTNFRLTNEQFNIIWLMWSGEVLDDQNDEYESDETRQRVRTHKLRERDPKLVKEAKEQFIKDHSRLYCEACGYDFTELYGFSYAEAHHKKPLHLLRAGEKTKVSDLGILCANCHRAVHRIDSEDPWTELLKLHKKL